MKPFFHLIIALTMMLSMGACSKNEKAETVSAPVVGAITATSLDTVAAKARGFTVGAVMSAQTIYVLFDPQCPHCARLWQASLPLHNSMKFVWIPIAFNAGKSLPQGAALLSAINPLQAMNEHETALLAGTGGMAASSSVSDDLRQAIVNNTSLLNALGMESVPSLIGKNRKTGALISHTGAMDTPALAQLLGLN